MTFADSRENTENASPALCMLQIAMLSLGFGEETTQREDERVDGLAKYNSWGTDVHALRGDARMESYTIIKLNVIYWGTIVIPWFLVLHDAIPLTIVVSYLKAHVLKKTILPHSLAANMVCQALWERDLDVVLTELDRMDEEEERKRQRKRNYDMGSEKSFYWIHDLLLKVQSI